MSEATQLALAIGSQLRRAQDALADGAPGQAATDLESAQVMQRTLLRVLGDKRPKLVQAQHLSKGDLVQLFGHARIVLNVVKWQDSASVIVISHRPEEHPYMSGLQRQWSAKRTTKVPVLRFAWENHETPAPERGPTQPWWAKGSNYSPNE